jgi:hypothetical protein
MQRNYYHYFVAGLQDIFLDDTEIHFPMLDFKQELKDHLKPEDYKLVELLFLPYDNQNLLKFLNEDYENHNDLGSISLQEFEVEFSDEKLGILPSYMYDFVELYKDEEESKGSVKSWENVLAEMYSDYVLKTKNKFLKQWFEFNQNLNNILIGHNCRKYNLEVDKQLIGDNFVSNAIINSNAKDFGLDVDLPYVSEIMALIDNENLLAREKGIDKLKWDKVEEITLFDYFTIEVVLTYTIKLDIAYRWLELDEETGREMFAKIIDNLKSGFEFPKEFAINGKNK